VLAGALPLEVMAGCDSGSRFAVRGDPRQQKLEWLDPRTLDLKRCR